MHAGLLWLKKFGGELIAKGFERSQADPCVFQRKHLGKVVVIIVVYVDDLLVLSETREGEEKKEKKKCRARQHKRDSMIGVPTSLNNFPTTAVAHRIG